MTLLFLVLCGKAHFGTEAIYWREASSGHSRSAYFVGKIIGTWFRLTISALHFTALFAVLATPLMPFGTFYVTNLFYFYCTFFWLFRPQKSNHGRRHIWFSILCVNDHPTRERAAASYSLKLHFKCFQWLWSSACYHPKLAS
jgi:hypothetical protein